MTSWVPFDLLDHLWQSTLFTAAVWLVTRAVRSNAARVRYWLWFAASVKFLVPISVLVSVGERFAWRTTPTAAPAVAAVIEQVLTPAAATVATVSSGPVAPSSSTLWPMLLLVAWSAGVLLVLAQWWQQWKPIRRALRDARPADIGDHDDVTVRASSSMIEPGVFGILRPVLLVPEGITDRLTPAQLRALIAHERCHIRHHDNLTASLHMAVEALFWFHPLVWWLERRLIEERERACDEYVLQSGSTPSDYAEGILEVCRFAKDPSPVFVAGITGADLRRRIESILQNPTIRPLGVRRALALGVGSALVALSPVVVGAVNTSARQQDERTGVTTAAFEVASIKQNTSGEFLGRFGYEPGGQLVVVNNAVRNLIRSAYSLQNYQILGGPDWMNSDRYDVSARAGGDPSQEQLRLMLRRLLSERFKLVARIETREIPIYALVVSNLDRSLGRGLRRAAVDCLAISAAAEKRGVAPQLPQPQGNRPACGTRSMPGLMMGTGVSMSDLAKNLAGPADRMVVDKTGLTGSWDFDLTYVLDQPLPNTPGLPSPPTDGAPLFTALQEQLGLKLEPQRAPIDVLVIVSIERPTEN